MDDLTAAQRVTRRLQWQRARFIVTQPDYYSARTEYWRHVGRGYRRFWIDLYRGRPWLQPLLIILAILLMLGVSGYLVYLGYSNRVVSENPTHSGDEVNLQSLRFIIAAVMLWVPINYWILRLVQQPARYIGRRAKTETHYARLVKEKDYNEAARFALPLLFWVASAIAVVSHLFFSLWTAFAVVLVAALLWLGGRVVFTVGELVFTAWNPYSADRKLGQWRLWPIAGLILIDLFGLASIPGMIQTDLLPHYSWVPVTGWLMVPIIDVWEGNWQAWLWLLAGVLVAIAIDYGLKKYQQSFAWRKRYLTKTKMHHRKDPSFQRALDEAKAEKVKEDELAVGGLAQDFKRRTRQSKWAKYCSMLRPLYLFCLILISIFPVALILLMHPTLKRVPVEEIANFDRGIALLWCVPVFLCVGLIHLASHQHLRLREFGKSPITIFQWWKVNLTNAGFVLTTSYLTLAPCVATIVCLFGMGFPWLKLGAAVGYVSVLVVALWMILASLLAMAHLWCFLPRWVKWFVDGNGALLLVVLGLGLFLSGIIVLEEFNFSPSTSTIAAAMAFPPILAVATMAYTYVITERLGDGHFAVKK